MKKRNAIYANLVGLGAATGFMVLAGCNDYTTGQDQEPAGPLMVTRLTLDDLQASRDIHIVTDTSAPLDCMMAPFQDTPACVNTPFKDRFSLKMSPPTPDSAGLLRVVFNKLPLKLNGADVEPVPVSGLPTELKLLDPTIIRLECEGCTGIPRSTNTLEASGSNLSPDPTFFPYGPALQMAVAPDDDDMLLALEPDTVYHVTLNPGLSGRNPEDKVLLDDAARALLTFRTEVFKPLQVGVGDHDHDPWIYASDAMGFGDGSAASPYQVAAADDDGKPAKAVLYNDGAIAFSLNAGVDESAFVQGTTATAMVEGTNVPVIITNNTLVAKMRNMMPVMECDRRNKRALYIVPMTGKWSPKATPAGDTVTITLKGTDIKDISQAANHPAGGGKHALSSNIVITAKLAGDTTPKASIDAGAVLANNVRMCAP